MSKDKNKWLAVAYVREYNYTVSEVARNFGVARSTIYRWLNEQKEAELEKAKERERKIEAFKEMKREAIEKRGSKPPAIDEKECTFSVQEKNVQEPVKPPEWLKNDSWRFNEDDMPVYERYAYPEVIEKYRVLELAPPPFSLTSKWPPQSEKEKKRARTAYFDCVVNGIPEKKEEWEYNDFPDGAIPIIFDGKEREDKVIFGPKSWD